MLSTDDDDNENFCACYLLEYKGRQKKSREGSLVRGIKVVRGSDPCRLLFRGGFVLEVTYINTRFPLW
jgi:hypothetical protein